jgi:hypothetical protein
MAANPYDSPRCPSHGIVELPSDSADTSSFSRLSKATLCLLGLGLFATNPWRDFYFYQDIAHHEGFGTTSDSYIVGVAGQLLMTVFFFPVATFLIVLGIAYSTRCTIIPRFDRFTWGWGLTASLMAVAMLFIEVDNIVYGLQYLHHLDTVLISLAYLGFIYVWWCCSLSHGPGPTSA